MRGMFILGPLAEKLQIKTWFYTPWPRDYLNYLKGNKTARDLDKILEFSQHYEHKVMMGISSGRLSSQGPNYSNLPRPREKTAADSLLIDVLRAERAELRRLIRNRRKAAR